MIIAGIICTLMGSTGVLWIICSVLVMIIGNISIVIGLTREAYLRHPLSGRAKVINNLGAGLLIVSAQFLVRGMAGWIF